MEVIIYFTELIPPYFNDGHRRKYKEFKVEQRIHVGRDYEGRQLIVGIMPSENIPALIDFLISLNKEPKICDVRKRNGVRYGFRAKDVRSEEDKINGLYKYKILPIADEEENIIEPYLIDEAERAKHFQPYEAEINGEKIKITPPDTSFGGWANWDERVVEDQNGEFSGRKL